MGVERLQIQEKHSVCHQEFAIGEKEEGSITPHCLLKWQVDSESIKWENAEIGGRLA